VRTCRRVAVTGPGWTDELARIFDPREEGPEWQRNLGYRGRPRLRLLLDGEDLVHSYAQALHQHTGKWTGPLSAGLELAFAYGAWGGGAPELGPNHNPEDPVMVPPEILTFVAMPSDLIEAILPGTVCDGYPEDLRQKLGRCLYGDEGYFINTWIRELQDEDRLITWNRPARLPGGKPRPNALLTQKYYKSGSIVGFRSLGSTPIVLSQVMGAGKALKVGEKVEALKNGRLVQGKWMPSQWMKAEVLAQNYDGTYDLQFEMNFGPYRERRLKGLRGLPTLSLRKNEVYKDFGADSMPAKFRMMQELNYAQAVPPTKIRLPGMLDRLSDTTDTEGQQDWYLCTSRQFVLTSSSRTHHKVRLEDFTRKFQLDYRWVPSMEGGLRFEPVPNPTMAAALRANHNDVAQQFQMAADADEAARRKLREYKEGMAMFTADLEKLPTVAPAKPSRPAGPRGRSLHIDSPPEPVPVAGGKRTSKVAVGQEL